MRNFIDIIFSIFITSPMAHYQQMKFIELTSAFFGWDTSPAESDRHILEIGSYDVNGSIRPFFPQDHYVGVDLIEGPGVDHVGEGHSLSFPDNHFDLTVSCESFEHNPYWEATLHNMYRMTKDEGFVVFTCASKGRLEHGTSRTTPDQSIGTQTMGWDYYRNLNAQDVNEAIRGMHFGFLSMLYNHVSKDLYFVGQKSEAPIEIKERDALRDSFEHAVQPAFVKDPSASSLFHCIHGAIDVPLSALADRLSDRAFRDMTYPYARAKARCAHTLRHMREFMPF